MSEEPKIIVDDDWKQQVQTEKEQLKSAEQPDAEPTEFELPEASFTILITTLSTQALAALGFLPDPITGKPTVNKPMAKHFIDILDVLSKKTSGNLEEEESNLLTSTLHQLRMAYLSPPAMSPTPPAPEKESGSSTIELP